MKPEILVARRDPHIHGFLPAMDDSERTGWHLQPDRRRPHIAVAQVFSPHDIPPSEKTALILTYHAASAALTGAMMTAEEVSERLGDTRSTPHPVRGWDDRASWVYSSDGRLITTSQAACQLLTYLGVPEAASQPLLSSPAAVCETLCAIIQDTIHPGGEAENYG